MLELCKEAGINKLYLIKPEKEKSVKKTAISTVFRCRRADESGFLAIKTIRIIEDEDIIDIIKEIEIWEIILRINSWRRVMGTASLEFQCQIKDKNRKSLIYYIGMEYLNLQLNDLIINNNKFILENGVINPYLKQYIPMSKNLVLKMMHDLIGDLAIMHINGIAHLDIKPQNIMYHQ